MMSTSISPLALCATALVAFSSVSSAMPWPNPYKYYYGDGLKSLFSSETSSTPEETHDWKKFFSITRPSEDDSSDFSDLSDDEYFIVDPSQDHSPPKHGFKKHNSYSVPKHGFKKHNSYSVPKHGFKKHNSYSAPKHTPSKSSGGGSPPGGDWDKSILELHNKYRTEHHVDAFEWDSTLAQAAASHAQTCVFHHSGNGYGENIAMGMNTPDEVLKAWVDDERSAYDYSSGGFSSGTGHFTQCVWKNTKYVGCAKADCPSGCFTVCNYKEPGNVQGQYQENVFPL